ncbi:MAG: sulfotransferase [Phycisphaeraceae bacterium]|nr:MAG: sulfotransferase [Phycisphaeraceae bacterium]
MSLKQSAPVQALLPYLRAVKYDGLRRRALRRARTPVEGEGSSDQPASAFFVGSGRSGTTMLGRLFERHPDALYLFEPYHAWAAIDARSDATNFHTTAEPAFFMDASFATPEARIRFVRTMLSEATAAGRRMLIEKTPHNVCRIGFIEALVPDASRTRYVHIVRDGLDVVRSIARLATVGTYRIAGKRNYNQWWGREGCKWAALARDGARAGYFGDEVGLLSTDAQRGAYEWLCSMGEAERWREGLGDRMLEIRYSELTASPREVVGRVCAHLGLPCDGVWLESAIAQVRPERRNAGDALRLPAGMRGAFNAHQERHGFEGRAEGL